MNFRLDNKLRRFISLLATMTIKDIRVRYKHAFLGFLWVFITPLLQMFVIATLFTFIIKAPIKNYYLFLFSGLLLWNFFSMTLGKATSCIIDQRDLIHKAVFPRKIIPLSIVFGNFFHFFVSVAILTLWVIFFGKIILIKILLLSVIFLWSLILTAGASLLLSAYNVKYRDVSYFLQIALQLLFYATPIIYPLSLIPSNLHILFFLNPLTALTQFLQYVFTGINPPQMELVLANIFITLLVFLAGWVRFSALSRSFDDWV